MATFEHGVASGDPLTDRVMLWTRVSGQEGTTEVTWKVATDERLEEIVAEGTALTGPERDHTVKLDVTALEPNTTYHYGFELAGETSPVGRTRTLPTDPTELTLAVTSCAKYTAGYFNALDRIAERDEVDFWLHLGDYIYEYPTDDGKAVGPKIGRRMDPEHECRSLDDYRKRYALHRRDEMVQRLHHRHPIIAICDDHEFCNDTWREGAKNHDDKQDGPWAARKAAALQAWLEWLPVRVEDTPLNRRFGFGRLADLLLIDTRTQRDEMVGDKEAMADPDRTLLGPEQLDWLLNNLSDSHARWKIVGGGVMVGQVSTDLMPEDVGNPLSELGILTHEEHGPNPDQWDGYPAERDRVLGYIEDKEIADVVFLSGDVHSSWAVDIRRDPDKLDDEPVAVEYVVTSITSENLDEELGDERHRSPEIEAHIRDANPHIRYCELDDHGYLVVTMTEDTFTGRWHYVDDILAPCPTEHDGPVFVVEAGEKGLRALD